LFGAKPFTGRLPLSWPRSMSQLPINVGDPLYDPQYAFGWGLRTDAARGRLQAARAVLALLPSDAHLANAIPAVDPIGGTAGLWNGDGSVHDARAMLGALENVVRELSQSPADTSASMDSIVSVGRDIVQSAILAADPSAQRTIDVVALTANAEHEL